MTDPVAPFKSDDRFRGVPIVVGVIIAMLAPMLKRMMGDVK